MWPVFLYSYLELIVDGFPDDGARFFKEISPKFGKAHADELRILESITLSQHVFQNHTTKLYRENKYRLPFNKSVYFNLLTHLQTKEEDGGSVVIQLLSTWCEINYTTKGPVDQFSFEAIINQARNTDLDDVDSKEGVEGAFTGVSNKDIMDNNAILKLGPMPMEPELAGDVRAELEDEDLKYPGQPSLVEEFDRSIKQEEGIDTPSRGDIPYPPSRARDVIMEVQKVKEYRDRFKIEGRSGGVGPQVSVCMFTFHNTLDS